MLEDEMRVSNKKNSRICRICLSHGSFWKWIFDENTKDKYKNITTAKKNKQNLHFNDAHQVHEVLPDGLKTQRNKKSEQA